MILVDTSVWIDHFRRGNSRLVEYLGKGLVLGHEFVIGELACGNLKNRREILALLREIPQALAADSEEVLGLIETYRFFGKGIGWIDAHLLASARLSGAKLWTLDKKLASMAVQLEISA
ncbi:MAG TPA: type II toxin-antitoxin system VapC family toxin [bacterium]|nr:type II toxin-antitoxin system VapC family toxin [bacterium]